MKPWNGHYKKQFTRAWEWTNRKNLNIGLWLLSNLNILTLQNKMML